MYRPNFNYSSNGMPFISNGEIDTVAEQLIADYKADILFNPQEIDIDRFATNYLNVDLDYQYLSHCGVYLGMTIFQTQDDIPVYDPELREAVFVHEDANTIIIDNSLLEENQEHRYRFTLGHESGHSLLHPSYFLNRSENESNQSYVICRSDFASGNYQRHHLDSRSRAEQQANYFSSAVLMPKCSVNILMAGLPYRGQPLWIEKAVTLLSETYNVSREAAFYRLKSLGYINSTATFLYDCM